MSIKETTKKELSLAFFVLAFFELQPKMHTFKKSNAYCDLKEKINQRIKFTAFECRRPEELRSFSQLFHGTCVLKWLVNSSVVVCVYILLQLIEFPFHQKWCRSIPTRLATNTMFEIVNILGILLLTQMTSFTTFGIFSIVECNTVYIMQ